MINSYSAMSKLNLNINQLASGKRITSANVDPAGLSVAEQLVKATKGDSQAVNNLSDARGMMNIADGGMQKMSDILNRQRELSVQSSNGLLNDSQRNILNNEFQELNKEIDSIVGKTEFNGKKLLNGSSFSIQSGTASNNQIELKISNMGTSTLGIDTADISSMDNARNTMNSIDNALKILNNNRTVVGAQTNKINHSISNSKNTILNTTRALSNIEDTDISQVMSEYSANQTRNDISNSVDRMKNDIARNNSMNLLG